MFLLSQRERNTDILCGSCQRLVGGECIRLVQCRDALDRPYYIRLARLSESGGYCQMYLRRPFSMDLNREGNELSERDPDEQ